jgi:LmbE family N-acetylglucosaminyl deacetylase
MNEKILGKDKQALVIVAHPDDETIWMGGTILKHPEIKWTIFSLCRASDRDRAPKFLKVCRYYKAQAIIADLEDEGRMNLKASLPAIKKIIKKKLNKKNYSYVFTHGANGEYGHPRHKGINLAVKELINKKIIKPEAVFYFNYEKIANREFSLLKSRENSDIVEKLSKTLYSQKIHIMSAIYGFDPKGIDASYCTNPEAFKCEVLTR